jgi:hypothetical protein
MAFVNEFVSEEEIAKYGLDDLMKRHDNFSWAFGRPKGFRHEWVIDRERSAFLLTYKRGSKLGPSGNPMPTSERSIWLRIGARDYYFVIDREPGGSTSQKDVPYRIIWRVSASNIRYGSDNERLEVEGLVREALVAYGFSGAWSQLPSTDVKVII